ncbi:MAG: VWA domain-containing protein [Spirochaetales bacterium]|nr:VWA domain-containing protein [Spirochaetales bacterium]
MKKIYKYAFWLTFIFFVITVAVIFTAGTPGFSRSSIGSEPPGDGPFIQIALLLDTSGSMDGLISQAKAHLWKIVNELSNTKKGNTPGELRVALYEYGNDSISGFSGHIRNIVPFTNDLDLLYEKLFNLKTNGGNEFCGMVMDKALNQLQWSNNNDDLKLIFIAGNEPFNQGLINYREICAKAVEKGIIINTIHCGDFDIGVQELWQDAALRGKGKYMTLNHNQEIVYIEAPQDDEIARLNESLNETYIPYGSQGKEFQSRQKIQDKNALSMNSGILVQRAAAKSTSNYSNSTWDVVDAVKNDMVRIEELKETDLPEEMKKMSKEERKTYIEEMNNKREEIQKEIMELYKERETYVAEQQKLNNAENSFDEALVGAIREQAESNGFSLGE